MRESQLRKNFEKMFLLRVCLPVVFQKFKQETVDAIEGGWATEKDFVIINKMVHKAVDEAIKEVSVALSTCSTFAEMKENIKKYNYFLWAYVESKNVKNAEELCNTVKDYYVSFEKAAKLGGE